MIDLEAIKARASTYFSGATASRDGAWACLDRNELVAVMQADVAALIAEVERLRDELAR